MVSSPGAFEVYTAWPFDSTEARRRQQETAASLQLPVEFGIDLGQGVMLTFELIPAGRSRLGSPPDEPGHEGDEALRFVTFQTPFYMCKTQLTRAQYKAVTGAYPNECEREDTSGGGGGSYPALVLYDDADSWFLPPLNSVVPQGMVVRFPTADEWEHACRAGTETTWYSGSDEAALGRIGWYGGNSGDARHPVGQKGANPWGLCDMVGNVWTWAFTSGGSTATDCLVKGGSFNSEAFGNGCRTGNLMIQSVPSGFRVMVDLPDAALGVRERAGRELRVSQAPAESRIHTVWRAGSVLLQGPGGAFLLTGRVLVAPGNSPMRLPAR